MKTLAISFAIGAVLGGSFVASTTTANKALNVLNSSLQNIEKTSKNIDSLKKIRKDLISLNREITERKRKIDELKKSLKQEGADTKAINQEIKNLGENISKLQKKYQEKKEAHTLTSKKLKEEKIDVKNLSKAYDDLKIKKEKVNKAVAFQNIRNKAKDLGKNIGEKSASVFKTGATMGTLVYSAVNKAIESESAYADVKKQFDFKDDKEAKTYRTELEKLITEKGIAIDLSELYSAAATAGQSGISKEESLDYIELASKMGVAFDISREQAAKTMFEWKNAFNKPLPELKKLIDQVNYLGNTTGANSPAISEFVNRVGNIGSDAGFDTGQIAAIGATLIEQGMAPEIAATGAKKIMGAMTKGFAATKGQKEIYEMLGLDSETLAKEAQKDAEGTVVKILSRIKNMPKEKQGAILTQLFGEEGMRGASGLLNNIERLQRNFSIVKNDSEFTGSSDKEFEARQNTTENSLLKMRQTFVINIRNLGDILLPTINNITEKLTKFFNKVLEFQNSNPKIFDFLVKAFAGIALGLTTIGVVGKGVSMAFNAFYFLSSPIGLVTTAIVALVLAGYALYKNWNTVKKGAIDLKNKIVELVDKYWYMLGPMGFVIKAGKSIYENWDTIKLKASELKEKLVEMVMNGINNFNEFKEKAVTVLGIPFDYMASKIENLKNLGKDLKDYFLEIFEEIKNFSLGDAISGGASFLVNKAKEYIPGFATGGFVSSPTLAMIGEGGASEAIIPLTRDSNSMNLWEKTGRLLGAFDNSSSSNNTNTTFNFTYSPVVNAKDAAGVKEVLENDARMSYEQFKGYFDRYQRETYRRGNGR
ncbi:phage tail tape measure protein [uncultured Fusobacterium sp.]|uniref:phage tail tape measure protein n=1 Tax=uncultured Fusobacterium sp. TaxID=159267 RepID=UPI0025E58C56|nr:phage tail tape measure protein [uncultured Fusobacterium sp.]